MFKKLLMIGLAISCCLGIAQANEPTTACSKDAGTMCDVSFFLAPGFGKMCADATADQKQVYIVQNNSPVTLPFEYIRVVNADGTINSAVSITTTTDSCGASLAAGAKCNIQVEATPTSAENFDLLLEVKMKDPTAKPISEPIVFSAVSGCAVTFTSTPSFEPLCSNSAKASQTFTITNSSPAGSPDLTIGNITLVPQPNNTFTGAIGIGTAASPQCSTNGSLAAGQSCNIDVDVTPGGNSGHIDQLLEVVINDVVLVTPITFDVSASCDVAFINPPVPFNIACGVKEPLTYTLKNFTNANQTIGAATMPTHTTPPPADDLTAGASVILSNNCPVSPATLAPNATCQIVVQLEDSCGNPQGVYHFNRNLSVATSPFGTVNAGTITSTITNPPSVLTPTDYLGNAGACTVFAQTTVTNTGPSVIGMGDVCLSPNPDHDAIVGFPPGLIPNGIKQYTAPFGVVADNAKAALATAITTLMDVPCTASLTGTDLAGLTLTKGVYCFTSTAHLNDNNLPLTLTGDVNSVFIFKIGTALTTASFSQVILSGVLPENVYWVTGSAATLGTFTKFKGNILAETSITVTTGASILNGRALAQAAVTLDDNAITAP
jgi:hypothetical protein